jgi:phosphoglycerol transferase MdoB-like AlkP superfamily enzyme
MIGAVVGLILLVVLLGVLFYCARMLLPLISPTLRILIILLVVASSVDVGRDMPPWKIGSQRLDLSTARSNSGQSKSAALGAILHFC